jgi:hypothetical protein
MSDAISNLPKKGTYAEEIFTCECRHCLTARKYTLRNPGAQNRSMAEYYQRNKDTLLLDQAWLQYKRGVNLHLKTLTKLKVAGFPVEKNAGVTASPPTETIDLMHFVAIEAA